MTFPDNATKPVLNVESRGGLFLSQTRTILLTDHLWNIGYCLVESQINSL